MAILSASLLGRLRCTVLAVSLWGGHPLPGQPHSASSVSPDPVLPSASPGSASWRQLPSYPQPLGVAGILAGTHRGVLIAAGGANFPGLPPWEGGRKAYYDDIHVLLPGAGRWQAAGRLPEARAYSAVLSLPDGVLVIGGENAGKLFANSLWLRWNGEAVEVSAGPRLPAATTSPVAAVLGQSVYVAAGYGTGSPRLGHAGFWRLDLTRPAGGWEELPVWPGAPRGQAVMAATGGAIHLFSGLELVPGAETGQVKLTYLLDAYRYRPETGWEKLADMPHSVVAAPTPAPVSANGQRIYLLGGVDNRRVGKQPRDTRVPDEILVFDTATATWHEATGRWPAPVVTTPAVRWNDAWVFVSGEIMAGVRTREVWSWTMPEEAQP
jgi:N-acetylneuraminate epimerase